MDEIFVPTCRSATAASPFLTSVFSYFISLECFFLQFLLCFFLLQSLRYREIISLHSGVRHSNGQHISLTVPQLPFLSRRVASLGLRAPPTTILARSFRSAAVSRQEVVPRSDVSPSAIPLTIPSDAGINVRCVFLHALLHSGSLCW